MRTKFILLAFLAIVSISAFADNVVPAPNQQVNVSYQDENFVSLQLNFGVDEKVQLALLDSNFETLSSSEIVGSGTRTFDCTLLPRGRYIIMATLAGETVYRHDFRK
jgi:hypothetical protein